MREVTIEPKIADHTLKWWRFRSAGSVIVVISRLLGGIRGVHIEAIEDNGHPTRDNNRMSIVCWTVTG